MKRTICMILSCLGFLFSAAAPADEALEEQGSRVFAHWCMPCHGDGPNFPGTTALRAKYQGQIEPVLADRGGMTPDFVKLYVRTGISIMPFFRKTEISDKELEALAAYLTRHE